jgi:hypothetical protein
MYPEDRERAFGAKVRHGLAVIDIAWGQLQSQQLTSIAALVKCSFNP